MKHTEQGWVVIQPNHPKTGSRYINAPTFAYTRSAAIESFVEDTSLSWRQWKSQYSFRVVRATQKIEAYFEADGVAAEEAADEPNLFGGGPNLVKYGNDFGIPKPLNP